MTYLGDQTLEPRTSFGARARLPKVLINHLDPLFAPTERVRPIGQGVLQTRGLLMTLHLSGASTGERTRSPVDRGGGGWNFSLCAAAVAVIALIVLLLVYRASKVAVGDLAELRTSRAIRRR